MTASQRTAGCIALASMALIGLYMIAVAINVVGRHGFRSPLLVISDMSEFLVPASLALAFPVAALGGSHLSIRFLGDALGSAATRVLEVVAQVATGLLMAVIAWQMVRYTIYLAESRRGSSMSDIPLWPVWALVALAFGASAVVAFATAFREAFREASRAAQAPGGGGHTPRDM